MLRNKTSWLWLGLGFISVTIGAYLAALHFGIVHGDNQICKDYPYPHQKDCSPHDPSLVFIIHIVEVANYLSPTIATLAAIAVAAFTFTLKRATDKLWTSAERSTFEQHRPWVFVDDIALDQESGRIKILIKNSGATPAREVLKGAFGRSLPVPFPSCPVPDFDDGSETFIAPDSTEIMILPAPSTMQQGYQYFMRIRVSYMLQDGRRDELHVDFAMFSDFRIRKVTPKDFAAYNGGETYTVGESFPIPD